MDGESRLPLLSKRIVITRSQDQQSEARKIFNDAGANVLDLPALVIGPPDDWTPLDKSLLKIGQFDWIIFSSSNGVQAVNSRLNLKGMSFTDISSKVKIAAVGKKTSAKLQSLGVVTNFVPPEYVAESLIQHFPEIIDGLMVLLPRVQSGGRTYLADSFHKLGIKVLEVSAYQSTCPDHIPGQTIKAFEAGHVDAITFTSGKTVTHTVKLLKRCFGSQWENLLLDVKIISIGPQTSRNCYKYLGKCDKEASPHDLNGLLDACKEILN